MGRAFDPYHKWLGIPPEEQPADYYRLLGIQTFEADPDVIQAAADQRMAHLRNYQTGQRADLSQRLLNEVAAARVGLLNPAKKAAYDKKLREKMQASQAAAQAAQQAAEPDAYAVAPSAGLLAGMLDDLDYQSPPVRTRGFFGRSRRRLPAGRIVAGVAAVGGALLLMNYWQGSAESPATPEATAQPQNPVGDGAAKKAKRTADAVAKKAKQSDATADMNTQKPTPSPTASLPKSVEPAPVPKKSSQAVLTLTPDTNPALPDPTAVASPDRGPPGGIASKRPPPRERVALPDAAAQDEAMKLARELYKDEFAKAKTAEDKQALAKKLFDQAVAASNADAGTFVLLQLAREIAVQGVDGTAAFAAIDAMAERYQVDGAGMKAEILTTFAKKAHTPPQHLLMAEQAARLMDEAAAAGSFAVATDLGKLAISEGGQGHSKELVARVKTCLPDFQNAAKLVADFEAAKAKLAGAPEDSDANLTAGRYYCFIKGDWKTGLPHLTKGNDPGLRVLAGKELASAPTRADEQVSLADGWWDIGQNEDGIAKLALLRRAKFWYAKADAALTGGLNKVKVQKRLDEIAKFEGEKAPAGTAGATIRFGKWFPLLTSPNELIGWDVGDCRHTYFNWFLELQEDCMFCPIVAKDMRISCLVNRNSGIACVVVRNSDAGCYAAALEDRKLKILGLKQFAEAGGNVPLRLRRTQEVLAEFTLPRSSTNVRLVLSLAVEGSVLTAFIDNLPVAQANDTAYTEGTAGVGVMTTSKVYVSDIELFIPNKASFVVDRRIPFGPSKGGAANEFKLPPTKSTPATGN